MDSNLLLAVVLLTSIPVGFLIAWMSRDELKAGRKWFFALTTISFLLAIIFYFFKNITLALTMIYIFVVSLISYIKSFSASWTRIRH